MRPARPGTASSGPSLPGSDRLLICKVEKGRSVFLRLLSDPVYIPMHYVHSQYYLCDGEDRCAHHDFPRVVKAYCSAVRWEHAAQDWFRTVAELTENAWIQLVFSEWKGLVIELTRSARDKRGRVDLTHCSVEPQVNLPSADNIFPTLALRYGRKHIPTVPRPKDSDVVYVDRLTDKLPPPPAKQQRCSSSGSPLPTETVAAFQAARARLSGQLAKAADVHSATVANTVGASIVSIEAARLDEHFVPRRASKDRKNAKQG